MLIYFAFFLMSSLRCGFVFVCIFVWLYIMSAFSSASSLSIILIMVFKFLSSCDISSFDLMSMSFMFFSLLKQMSGWLG